MARWFRHYAGMMRDEKLVRAAVRARQPVERVVWVFGAMLESACEVQDGGRFDLDAEEVAYFLRCDVEAVEAIISALEAIGRTSGDRIAKWSERQYEGDSSAARVRKHRERKRNGDETLQPVTVTPPETETDTEYTEEPSGSSDADASGRDRARDALISEGRPKLMAMGVSKGGAAAMIGRWLRDTGDDHARVLEAISRARDQCPHDPLAWITARLKEAANDRQSPDRSNVVSALRRIGEKLDAVV